MTERARIGPERNGVNAHVIVVAVDRKRKKEKKKKEKNVFKHIFSISMRIGRVPEVARCSGDGQPTRRYPAGEINRTV
jgi:hypothetical protein